MKRNLDTVRKLLKEFELSPAGETIDIVKGEYDNTPNEIVAHIELMIKAGLLEGEAYPSETGGDDYYFWIEKITWSGHDFIDAARNEDVWNTTKRKLTQAGSWTFSLVLEVLREEAKRRIGVSLGS